MSAPAAFQATYADFKLIKTRRVVQVILELPLERADEALAALGGLPKPDGEVWLAVARLQAESAKQKSEPAPGRRRWEELSFSQQAGIRCADPTFHAFLREERKATIPIQMDKASEASAQFVRKHCLVDSRSALKPGTNAADAWIALDRQYQAWLEAE